MASLAMQKKEVHKNEYLVISYMESGINNKVIIEPYEAGAIYNFINKSRVEYNREHQILTNEDKATSDITDRILNLSELKDEGILTEDEFQNKKSELLLKL